MSDNNVLKPPFNLIINGPTGTGKTQLLLKMLETQYKNAFSYVILLCPTFSCNLAYKTWKFRNDPNFLPIQCDQADVEIWLKEISSIFAGTDTLIILDDVASSQAVKNQVSELVRLAFSARHYGLSVIVLTQQLTSIAKAFRKNSAKIISFYEPDEGDMNTLLSEGLAGVSKTEKADIIQQLKTHAHSYIEINRRHPFDYRVVIQKN